MYFVIGFLILFYTLPQQIAIPCILCACFADPFMGELRFRYGKQGALIGGFGVCFLLFIITWIQAEPWVILVVALLGALCAVAGETWKSRWIDDDFLIQILPAVAIAILWQILLLNGMSILPIEILVSW